MKRSEFVQALGNWREGTGPIYRRLALALRRSIEEGIAQPGADLPAERVLAETLSVSRTTVVAAYDLLRDEGLIESVQGSGTRIGRSSAAALTRRDALAAGAFQRNTVFRGLLESTANTVELLGVHLPAASPHLEQALAHAPEDIRPLLTGHGYCAVGFAPLRSAIARHLDAAGLPTRADQILVTHGAQQAIVLAATLFISPGDTVLLEDPTYLGAIDVFQAAGARLIGVPVGEEGVRVDLLTQALRESPRLIYLMPTFHNPTGAALPEAARREIARLAQQHGIPVLEDNTLADLRDETPPPPPLAAFSRDGNVLTVGSLSKLLWGGLRVGWIRAESSLIARLARLKAMSDLGNDLISQAVATRLLDRAEAIRRSRSVEVREQREALCAELARQLPEWTWRPPAGGLSLWVRLPRGSASELASVALRHGVAIVPGGTCCPRNGCAEFLRVPFVLPPREIREGVTRLARAWKAYVPAPRRAREGLSVLV